jgi:vitamin B12 transporter
MFFMKNNSFSARPALLAPSLVLSFVCTQAALAQSSGVSGQLNPVVVTATRNSQLLGSALPFTSVITRDDIERSQATDLVTLLQREAGLQRTQNGGIGSVSSVFIRGAASLQTLILIDGVPQNKQDASGAVSLEHVMLENVERVEIVRGNVSAIYGSGAIGGVIQIFTKTGSREPSASVSAQVGPRATRKLSANLSGSVGSTAISVGVSRFSTDGFSTIDTTQFPSANPDADSYRNTSGNLSLTHTLSADHQFGVRFSKATGDTAYDNAYGAPSDIQTATTRLSQAALFTDNTFGRWRSRITLSEQSDKSETRDSGSSNDGFKTTAKVINWVNTVALGGDWLATAGLERQKQSVDTTTTSAFPTYAMSRSATAVFAGIEGKVVGGGLQLNVRRDKVGDLAQTTGYAGYGYPLTQQLKLIGSVSTAFNAPPLGYLFAPGFGNPNLRPELARSKEIGLQYEQGSQFLRAAYFDTRVKDQLNFDNTTFAFANIGRARNKGWELSYKASLGATDLRSSLTLQDPIDEITGQPLSRRAKTLFSAGVSHAVGAWRLGADLQYSGKRPDAYADPVTFTAVDTTLAAYSVVDLSLSYRVSPTVELKARVDNVSNEKYQTVYGYNQQPRSAYVGVTWTPLR